MGIRTETLETGDFASWMLWGGYVEHLPSSAIWGSWGLGVEELVGFGGLWAGLL